MKLKQDTGNLCLNHELQRHSFAFINEGIGSPFKAHDMPSDLEAIVHISKAKPTRRADVEEGRIVFSII